MHRCAWRMVPRGSGWLSSCWGWAVVTLSDFSSSSAKLYRSNIRSRKTFGTIMIHNYGWINTFSLLLHWRIYNLCCCACCGCCCIIYMVSNTVPLSPLWQFVMRFHHQQPPEQPTQQMGQTSGTWMAQCRLLAPRIWLQLIWRLFRT